MSIEAAAKLRSRLDLDDQVVLGSLQTATDKELAIGQDVWRLQWQHQPTTAVASDADLHTTCGALLDALTLFEMVSRERATAGNGPVSDLSTINVLVDRPLPGDDPSETDEALRSMRDATIGETARIWYQQAEKGWPRTLVVRQLSPKMIHRVADWVNNLLLPRLTAQPGHSFSRWLQPSMIRHCTSIHQRSSLDPPKYGHCVSTDYKLAPRRTHERR